MYRLTACLMGLVLGAVAVLGSAAATQAAGPTGVTIKLSDASVPLGSRATISGRGPALRSVFLELRTGENGWQLIGRGTTGLTGGYSFTGPRWYGAHQLRVRVLGTVLAPTLTSATRTLRVEPGYRPRGQASDWTWLTNPGARWEPCETITYRVNPQGGHPNALKDVAAAFAVVSAVTGFQFKDMGATSAEIRRGKHGYHPPDTDIVIDWQTPEQESGLSGGVAGIGGHWVQAGRRFDGWVLLDRTEHLTRSRWTQVITHELGHVVGLSHAEGASQMMYGTSSDRNRRWGAGDLAGLWRLGASQGCLF